MCFLRYMPKVTKGRFVYNLIIFWNIRQFTRKSTFQAESQEHNPLPHTTILQQTTLNIYKKDIILLLLIIKIYFFYQKIENLYNWMDNLWLKLENIVIQGKIARSEQFLIFYVFKNPSAAEASESVYMRERVNEDSQNSPFMVNPFYLTTVFLNACTILF